jgi:endonuclease/exonuclease/phosphatase family metal-dependent hydrolase
MAAHDRAPLSGLAVASYNVWLARHVERVLDVLAAHERLGGADVLAVQEADERIVERIAARFGWHAVYHPSGVHHATGRNFGPAIFSRWPLADDRVVALPRTGWRPRIARTAVSALVQRPGGPLHVCNVHLSTMLETSPGGQDLQAEEVVRAVAALQGPVVVLGDFNRRGAARVFARAGFAWHTRQVGPTHHVWSFDHVLSRGVAGAWQAGAVRDALRASDHRAVWTWWGAGALA